ncbi:hypothetical protein RR51_18155 [Pseudomonas sp. C5pp]|nr:hypothetical protein RR51_18155 [Pseudomonas sp. C5pp]
MDVEAASQESDDFLLSLTDVHFVDGDVRVYGQDVGESLLQLHQQLTGNVGESFRFHGLVILMWPHENFPVGRCFETNTWSQTALPYHS